MIGPKRVKQTKADRMDSYELCVLRDLSTCQMCHKPGLVQMDHRQNRDKFNTVTSNLQALCMACHQRKTENPAWGYLTGWGVPRWADPSAWAVPRMVAGQWVQVLLDDVGGWVVVTEQEARKSRDGSGTVW